MVEFAIIAPVFFVFVLGLVELGRGLMVQHLLTNAARQGCRLGVIEGKTYTDIQNAAKSVLGDIKGLPVIWVVGRII